MLDKSKVTIKERFQNHPIFNELHCGMNFGFMARRGYYSRKDVLAQPAKMVEAGVNYTTLNANICQETYHSRKIFLDFSFSSGEIELTEMARAMRDQNLRILLKPCLTPLDGAWMGNVNFPVGGQIQGVTVSYWAEWFASFTESIKYYAEFAERNKIEALIIGAEYYGAEWRSDEWRKVIETVRSIYSGPLTYEFTHASKKAYKLDWFEDLDFLSYSYYPPACAGDPEDLQSFKDNPRCSTERMVEHLSSRRAKIESVSESLGNKPIAFTEIGVRSAHGCVINPCDFRAETWYDGEEQAAYMEAVFRTFWDMPQWMGMYWWKWDETQIRPQYHTDPRGDMGFTIQGKPAEEVMRRWFAKNPRG